MSTLPLTSAPATTPVPRARPELSTTLSSFVAESDLPHDWGILGRTAERLDRAGIDKLVVSDHVVFGEHLEEYARPEIGGQVGGVQPTGPDGHWLEPLTTLTFVAGRTTRIRLGTNILIAALRRPVTLAKAAATLDVLSRGRLDIAVGVGWQREEYEAAGLSFENRGRLLDHTLEVCQTLWRETRAEYDSPELRFENIHLQPKPVQQGGVPIWVSGTINPRVVRRLARFGTGWVPWGDAASDLVAAIPRMKAALAEAGRDPTDLLIVGTLPVARNGDGAVDPAATMAGVPALIDAGVTDVRLRLVVPDDDARAEDMLRPLVEQFRSVVGRNDPVG